MSNVLKIVNWCLILYSWWFLCLNYFVNFNRYIESTRSTFHTAITLDLKHNKTNIYPLPNIPVILFNLLIGKGYISLNMRTMNNKVVVYIYIFLIMIKMYNIRCAPVVPSIYCLLRTECDRKPSASEDVRTRTVWTRRTYVFYFQIFHHSERCAECIFHIWKD